MTDSTEAIERTDSAETAASTGGKSQNIYNELLHSISLEHHILAECIAMAKYAFSSGLEVPGSTVARLDAIASLELGSSVMMARHNPVGSESPVPRLYSGLRGDNSKELAQIHARLSTIVRPATPRTILLLATESVKGGFWSFLGPVRLVRHMAMMAIACLVAFIVISLSSFVDTQSLALGIFDSSGEPLLMNLLFLLSAAGLGACFAALFQANRYIADGTFDPKYESSYWIRLILGLMAGMMLSQLIPLPEPAETSAGGAGSTMVFARPTLAMLGGFSAAVVYRIIQRLVEAVESLVRGDARELIVAQQAASQARTAEQIAQERIRLAGKLTALQQQLASNPQPEILQHQLNQMLGSLIHVDPDYAVDLELPVRSTEPADT